MSHNIMEGRRMCYTGEKPWHELGTRLERPATALEAITAADLNYTVEKRVLSADGSRAGGVTQELGAWATVVKETSVPLGVVGGQYRIIQNRDAFDFFDGVVGEGQAIYHTAGALGKGERVWILAKLPDDVIVTDSDIVNKFLLLTTTHDGSSALKMYFTPIRVVCQNTLMASYRDMAGGVSIRHTANAKNKLDEARRLLGLALNYYARFSNDVNALVRYRMSDAELEAYFKHVLHKVDVDNVDLSSRDESSLSTLEGLFRHGRGNELEGVKGTAWAAYNAVTEWVDYYRAVRNERKGDGRAKSILFGTGATIKSRAFEAILNKVGGL